MRRLALTQLGSFEARLDDGLVLTFPTRKIEGLLAHPAPAPGQAPPRDDLATVLWHPHGPRASPPKLRRK